MTADNQEHKPGDRWTHRVWPEGTQLAVVLRIEEGCVTWDPKRKGGAAAPNILARHLVPEYGWTRVEARR